MSLERRIAAKARELVVARQQPGPTHEAESKYRGLCESFPILLRSSGLAQTTAFLRAKGKDEYADLYADLSAQFRNIGIFGQEDLAEKASSASLSLMEYRLYSEIAQRVALWQKRLAQALLRKKDEA